MKKGFYLVGGAVRDKFFGFEPSDRDYLAVGYKGEELESMGFEPVGKDFPVFLHPETKEEYALPRKERSTGKGYKDFSFDTENVSVEEDLSRRDLTINSMALTPEGKLIDPYGGLRDLENKVLRHTTEAFKEDPVRVLRIARFNARYPDFRIAEETKEFIFEMKDMLHSLTKERVFKEMEKALSEVAPEKFFITLFELGVLDILFPEIYAMTKVEHNNKFHMEGSVFNHSMLVLKIVAKMSVDPVVRFGALYHDIGKAPLYNKTGKMHGHDSIEVVMEEFDKVKSRYNVPKKYINMALSAAINHHKIYNIGDMKGKTIVKMVTSKYWPKNEEDINRLLVIVEADTFGRIIHKSGPMRVLDLYDSLFYIDFDSFKKGERQYETEYVSGKAVRSDHVNKDFILKACKAVKSVSVKDISKDSSVEFIREELHRRRIRAVAEVR